MRSIKTIVLIAFFSILGVSVLLTYATGCQSSSGESAKAGEHPADSPIKQMFAPPQKKGGSELWAENCTRCHNARPPQYYSDAQWDIIVHHMRLRADLTGEEARAVAEFLKASN
jgi:hypothetical protein